MMHAHNPTHGPEAAPLFPARPKPGFALISSLLLMMMVLISVIGLFSLASISLRTSASEDAHSVARANARLALMLAIGELQATLGPDQSVSAKASSLDPSAPQAQWLGAWSSWRWNPTGGTTVDYSEKRGQFEGWLVSSPDPRASLDPTLASSPIQNSTPLIQPQTPTDGNGLQAPLVPVEADRQHRGRYAWAIVDESQKAPVHLPQRAADSSGEIIARRTSPGRANPGSILGELTPSSLGDPLKVVSFNSVIAAAGASRRQQIQAVQQDITPHSLGLLTDAARGGLKTDLTPLFETPSSFSLAAALGAETPYFEASQGAPTWDYLRSHYQLYQKTTQTAQGTPTVALTATDFTPATTGLNAQPVQERLMPVIAKLQIMFSMVTHHVALGDRINFYNENGNPKGYENYAVPFLVYDPVVTLYNPYDVALEFSKLRLRVSDPPVLFGFKKNGEWLRSEFGAANGSGFQNLARFQLNGQFNAEARRYFTLVLAGGTQDDFGGTVRMEPGEVRVFAPRVQSSWNWGWEYQGVSNGGRVFFDHDQGRDFGNRDTRGSSTSAFGVDTAAGWDPRAGFQVDHLSYSEGRRPTGTLYPFERERLANDGWIAIRLNETFTVAAKAGRGLNSSSEPDFVVDLLSGNRQDMTRDYLRSYRFRFQDATAEISADPGNPIIERTQRAGDLLQLADDADPGGKTPFAILTMGAKTTMDPGSQSMPWLHNHPVVEGLEQDSNRIGNALDAYDVRLDAVGDFNTFPGIEIEPGTNRGFYGARSTANEGVTNVPMFRVPLIPAASLGDFIPGNLVASSVPPRVTHPLGNSHAHPLIPTTGISRSIEVATGNGNNTATTEILDHSYLLNDALWDRFFFSTATANTGELFPSQNRRELLEQFFAGETPLLNHRLTPLPERATPPSSRAQELDQLEPQRLSETIASSLGIAGPFNVNSDSENAWAALLSSLRGEQISGWRQTPMGTQDKTAFPRTSIPIAGDAETENASLDVAGQVRWAGFRALTDEQIALLARHIVEEIRLRGNQDGAPIGSVGEFVNRRLGNASGLHVLKGLLATAIEKSGINEPFHNLDSLDIGGTSTGHPSALEGLAAPQARLGKTAEGAPSMLTQGDLLMALAPAITVRGDTFLIRTYGDARDSRGNITSRAWCEAVLQRVPDYLDPVDTPEVKPERLSSDANRQFGRRFIVTSFRWLTSAEI